MPAEGTNGADDPKKQAADAGYKEEEDPEPKENVDFLVEHINGESTLCCVGILSTHQSDAGHTTIGHAREQQGLWPLLTGAYVACYGPAECVAMLISLCSRI